MALDSYQNLKTAISNFSHRTDISDVVDDFIVLAENRIDNSLRINSNNLRATATASTSDRFLALPTRFLKMRRFTLISDDFYHDVNFLAPDSMNIYSISGLPKYFTITNQIEFERVCDQAYSLEISYWSKLNPLSDSNTTNNVLTDHPQIYLTACLMELNYWANNDSEALKMESKFNMLVDKANEEERNNRIGPSPVMRIEGATP